MPVIAKDSCGICVGNPVRKQFVDNELVKGTPHTKIEARSRELGMPVKRETIRRHVTVCVPKAVESLFEYRVESESPEVVTPPGAPRAPSGAVSFTPGSDFASLVRDEAGRKLAAGELHVRVGDGLAAQALLDKRMEKVKDRDLMLQLGRLLGGAKSLPPPIVEGEFTEMGETLMIEG